MTTYITNQHHTKTDSGLDMEIKIYQRDTDGPIPKLASGVLCTVFHPIHGASTINMLCEDFRGGVSLCPESDPSEIFSNRSFEWASSKVQLDACSLRTQWVLIYNKHVKLEYGPSIVMQTDKYNSIEEYFVGLFKVFPSLWDS